MRLLFMGTPDFALPSLRVLIARGDEIVGVVSQPDRPKGRGETLTPPPVKETAQTHGLPIYQPEKVRSPEFIKLVETLHPDMIVVVAFGQILPAALLRIPPRGPVNVHASLLPRYRGAAPVAWAILNGERETGVTTMLMDEGMDSGPILLQRKTEILPGETSESLGKRLSCLGAELLLETLDRMEEGSIQPIPQDPLLATYAPLLKKEDGLIDWSKGAAEIERRIRAMNPWPGAYTFYKEGRWRLWSVEALEQGPEGDGKIRRPGEVILADDSALEVAAGNGYLKIQTLQPENRRRMTYKEFLAGHRVEVGSVLSSVGGHLT
ncbi:MAG TPA: methionyl-tRNA formyltransferase [Nitrospiria bacterium]|nr:methionyl-tRNA formyltransferase [Nitrospiria bacterium]